jgi:hypothetical protein
MTDPLSAGKIKPWHLDRSASVYIRQSDPQQIVKNPEATAGSTPWSITPSPWAGP